MAHSAALHRLRVVARGPASLLAGVNSVLDRVNRIDPGATVHLSLEPSILSQLCSSSLAGWQAACTALYTGARPDLTILLGAGQGVGEEVVTPTPASASPTPSLSQSAKLYSQVVVGGTFDRLHAGHKILLTAALVRCEQELVVGVAGPALLKRKTLPELILPLEVRLEAVQQWVELVRPGLTCTAHHISDPFGPAAVLPGLQCIVGSRETEAGCRAVNTKRAEAGLEPLDIELVDLLAAGTGRPGWEEEKVSSSAGRQRLLGSRLRPPLRPWASETGPCLVGLTGGSASGKSSVARRLAGLGWGVVDCDKLGHQAYLPGTPCHAAIAQEFGPGVLDSEGRIDRRALGGMVFGHPTRLQALNSIVWPEIARLAMERAGELWRAGHQLVVLDAAVLLEAGWDSLVHEVWVCVLPRDEAVSRIVDRDGKTAEEAGRRVDSQLGGADRAARATTVLSTQWQPEFTQQQVERAAARLLTELGIKN